MSPRGTLSIHSQDLSHHGQPSTQDKANSSEAKLRYPPSFDQRDETYDYMDESKLRTLCQKKGYAKGGKKADLIQRLRNHDARGEKFRAFTHAPTPDHPVGAGWLDLIKFWAMDMALLLLGIAVVAVLLWFSLTGVLSYSALITVRAWFGPAFGCFLALAFLLQVGRYIYHKPHSEYRSPTFIKDLDHQINDPEKLPADSPKHRPSVPHTLQKGQQSSNPRLDSNRGSFALNMGEADRTQPPPWSTTPVGNAKDLEALPRQRDSATTASLSPTAPTSSEVPLKRDSGDALPTANQLSQTQTIPASNVEVLQSRHHHTRSIEADLPHDRKARGNDPRRSFSRDRHNSDGTLSSSSLTAIADKEEALEVPDKGKESDIELARQTLDESRRTQEILQQKETEEERFQTMCQRFKDRPNIWVVVRFRDKIPSDEGKPTLPYRHVRKKSYEELSIDLPQDTRLDQSQSRRVRSIKGKTAPAFRIFDYILFPPASNISVFETIKPMIEILVNGRQVCIMADGQSGTGKSYTMLKGPEPVAALAAQAIFDGLNAAKGLGWEYSVECSILEIQQEHPNDLLIPALKDDRKQQSNSAPERVQISRKEPYLNNCSCRSLTSADEFMTLLHQASQQRASRKTKMNQSSSRSDLISIISISRSHTITGETTSSRFYLVDLVGSESGSDRSIPSDEGKKIKEGRESLKRAMQAYQNRSGFVPKDSQLTLLLSSCFKAPSRIVYLVTASPLLEDRPMTKATITFASEVRKPGGTPNSRNSAK